MRAALGVDPTVLNRWANFNTQKADNKKHPEAKLNAAFVKYLASSQELSNRGYSTADFTRAFSQYDDKKFLQFLVARSLPASVRELSLPKYDQVHTALLGDERDARYLMYRLGTFEQEDLAAFPNPAGQSLLAAQARVLRRVPISIEELAGETFLLYREAYRSEESIGSVFHVDTHYTIWGQDYNNNTSELFLITIKRTPIPSGTFLGLFPCAVLMLGDCDRITACKALIRRVPNQIARVGSMQFKDFAREMERTIALKDETIGTGFEIDSNVSTELVEPHFDVPYEKYVEFLNIEAGNRGIILR
jgi:hypothetical protein